MSEYTHCETKCNERGCRTDCKEHKGFIDKTKEVAHDAKEKIVEGFDKLVGNTPEDKAARDVKKAANKCADKVEDAREQAGDRMKAAAQVRDSKINYAREEAGEKMRDAARKVEPY